MNVTREQRHLRDHRCRICGGADGDPRGKGKRCSGFSSSDGEWVHCSRGELAGELEQEAAGTYAHRMRGPCKCGTTHGEDNRIRDEIESTYDYNDEGGALLFQVVRKSGKRFLQRKPDGAGGWDWKLNGARRVPYRLRELLEDDGDRPVYVVEGEKDADALARQGHTATTNPGGCGKWHTVADVAKTALQGRDVVVIADADEVGRKHAHDVATSLRGVARSVRVTEPTKPHKDVSDLLAAGGTLDSLVPIDHVEPDKTAGLTLIAGDAIFAPLPPTDYLVDPILPRGALALVGAYAGSGKTWLAVALMLAVGAGAPWLGRFPTKRGAVLFLDFESGDLETRRRLQKAASGMGVDVRELAAIAFASYPKLYALDADFEARLTLLAEGRDLIVIDSLRAVALGIDENDSRIREPLDVFQRVAKASGCTIVVIVHSKKLGVDRGNIDEREVLRGSSAIIDAADVAFAVGFTKGEPLRIVQIKARTGLHVPAFEVSLDDTPDGRGILLAARDVEAERKPSSDETFDTAIKRVRETLREHPGISGKVLRERCRGTRAVSVDAALDTLIERAEAVNLGSKQRPSYRLKEGGDSR